jgi:hypothetical protein
MQKPSRLDVCLVLIGNTLSFHDSSATCCTHPKNVHHSLWTIGCGCDASVQSILLSICKDLKYSDCPLMIV